MRLSRLSLCAMVVSILIFSQAGFASLVSYWSFDTFTNDKKGFSRTLGDSGELSINPEGWFTSEEFESGRSYINEEDCQPISYEYMLIKDPASLFSDGRIVISNLDLTGYSDLNLSFAAQVTKIVSLEYKRKVICYVGEQKLELEPTFEVSEDGWGLVDVDLPEGIDNESDVTIEIQFYDIVNFGYELHVDNIKISGVPEPATFALVVLGTVATLARRRRRG